MKLAVVRFLWLALALLVLGSQGTAQTTSPPPPQPLAETSLARAFFPNINNVLALSADGSFALAGSFETDSVFAFKPGTGEKLGEVTVGDGPTQIIVQGNQAAVFNTATLALPRPTISLLDISQPQKLRVTATCVLPENLTVTFSRETLALSRDGRVVFGCAVDKKNRGTLFAFDTQTGTQLGALPVGNFPLNAQVIERNGGRTVVLALTAESSSQLVFVTATNPAAMKVSGTLPFPGKSQLTSSNSFLVNEAENLGFMALPKAQQLVTFRLDPPVVLDQTPIGPIATRLVRRNNRLLVQEEGGATVGVFDLSQPEKPKFLSRFESNGTSLFGVPAFSSDGKLAYALSPLDQTLYIFDVETGMLRATFITQGEIPVHFVFTGGSCAILVPSARAVECLNLTALPPQRAGIFFTPGGVTFDIKQAPLVTGDGKRAYVASPLTHEILEIDPETTAVTGRIATNPGPNNLTLFEAPGIRRLAVTTTIGATVDLFSEQTDGTWKKTGVFALPGDNSYLFDFANVVFSRDGKTGFVADVQNKVYAFDGDNGTLLGSREVGDFPAGLSLFESATGERRIAVSAGSLGQKTTVTVLDGSNPRELKPLSTIVVDKDIMFALDNLPLFSADGETLYLGASFSNELLTINIKKAEIVGRVGGITAAQIVPFEQKGKPAFLAANLENGKITVLTKDSENGLAKGLKVFPPKDNFFLVSNLPVVLPGGQQGVIGSYGLKSVFLFSTVENKINRQITIPGAVGRLTLLPNRQAVLGVEINGAANRIFRVNLN